MDEPTIGDGPVDENERPTPLVIALLVSVFVVATCGLVYELLASTIASYLLGDSVTQFSTVIGTYLFAMGIGSFVSRYVAEGRELGLFVRVEMLIALIGGCCGAALFMLFPFVGSFRIVLYGIVFLIGAFVGLEIPLLMRIMRGRYSFGETVSTVLTFDYVGALAASLLFPLLLVPQIGLVRTGFLFGLMNIAVAIAVLWLMPARRAHFADRLIAAAIAALLLVGMVFADGLQRWSENAGYQENVIYAASTPYQRIALTRGSGDLRLYLNGNLQFSSRDEYRYHEALVHPAMGRVARPANVLILGGGDGLAAREVLRHPGVEHLTLVDLDPAVTRLFASSSMLTALNRGALTDPKMHIINADAFGWIRGVRDRYDVVIVDFPDPVDFAVGKLYTDSFYRELARALRPGGVVAVQSTSPLVAPRAFWTVATTMEAAGFTTRAYHAYVPSFGEWGFTLASLDGLGEGLQASPRILPNNRFLDAATERRLFDFPPDMARRPVQVNRLDNQSLVRTFAAEWADYEN
ncbi:MAG: polyamine aminopropyltransferase [Sphingopyxis sp.]